MTTTRERTSSDNKEHATRSRKQSAPKQKKDVAVVEMEVEKPKPAAKPKEDPQIRSIKAYVKANTASAMSELRKKTEAGSSKFDFAEVQKLIEEKKAKAAFILPLMHFLNRSSIVIDKVWSFRKNTCSVCTTDGENAVDMYIANNTKGKKVNAEMAEVIEFITNKFKKRWWKVPFSDMDLIKNIIAKAGAASVIITGYRIEEFPDRETGATIKCIMPTLRYEAYYPGASASSSSSSSSSAEAEKAESVDAAAPKPKQTRKRKQPTAAPSSPEAQHCPHGDCEDAPEESACKKPKLTETEVDPTDILVGDVEIAE